MSYQELTGQLRFLFIAAGSALGGRSLKSVPRHRRVRARRRAISTGPILAPSWAPPRLRFAQ